MTAYSNIKYTQVYTVYLLCPTQNNSLIFYTKYYDCTLKTCFVEMY